MSSEFQLIPSRDAVKFLQKQDRGVQERIVKSLNGLKVRPPLGDIKPLKGTDGLFRLRVGNYRIIFSVHLEEQNIKILTIDNRGDVYNKKL